MSEPGQESINHDAEQNGSPEAARLARLAADHLENGQPHDARFLLKLALEDTITLIGGQLRPDSSLPVVIAPVIGEIEIAPGHDFQGWPARTEIMGLLKPERKSE